MDTFIGLIVICVIVVVCLAIIAIIQEVEMKTKTKIEKIFIQNRWKRKKYELRGTRTLIGWSIFYFSPSEFEYVFSLLGFDLRIWFRKVK